MPALTYNRKRKLSPEVVGQIQRVVGVEPTGEWNDATVTGVREFQADHGLEPDGKVGPGTLDAIQKADALDDDDDHEAETITATTTTTTTTTTTSTTTTTTTTTSTPTTTTAATPLQVLTQWCSDNNFTLVDYRDLNQWPRKKTYTKDYGYPLDKSRADPPKGGIRREWTGITAFMLHTTAVGGMTAKRGVGIPCHLFLPKEDAVVLCHELELLLYHGHDANKFSVGLEISGVSDWDSPNQIERAKALLRYFQAVRRAALGPDADCYVMAHRQSHESRVNDPGKRIWQDVGEWAIEELGFRLGPVVGSGKSLDPWRKRK